MVNISVKLKEPLIHEIFFRIWRLQFSLTRLLDTYFPARRNLPTDRNWHTQVRPANQLMLNLNQSIS